MASRNRVRMPILMPKLRTMFMVPGLPLPCVRMSVFFSFEMMMAKLMLPHR